MAKECSLCKGAFNFHIGLKGKNSDNTKLLFIANKPDSRVLENVLPNFDSYEMALLSTKTGKMMYKMLRYCGLSFDDIYWTNTFKCVLPNDRIPKRKEYENCFNRHLKKQINDFKPKKIVALGEMPYNLMFPDKGNHTTSLVDTLDYRGIPVFIMSHPGKIWYYSDIRRQEEFYETLDSFINNKVYNSIIF